MADIAQLVARVGLPGLRARGGDRSEADAVFQQLVDAHYRRIYNLVCRMIANEADAADLTQEAFVRAYRALPRLRAEAAQGAWMRRIATNICLDYLRRRRATPPSVSLDARTSGSTDDLLSWDIPDPAAEPDRLLAGQEREAMLRRAIDALPEDYRTVVVLHHIEEMGVDEIADLLKVPNGTIKSRLSRARRELHRRLCAYFDPELARF